MRTFVFVCILRVFCVYFVCIWCVFCVLCNVHTFLDGYCSTVQGLLDWLDVDLGFTELSFIQIGLCVFGVYSVSCLMFTHVYIRICIDIFRWHLVATRCNETKTCRCFFFLKSLMALWDPHGCNFLRIFHNRTTNTHG